LQACEDKVLEKCTSLCQSFPTYKISGISILRIAVNTVIFKTTEETEIYPVTNELDILTTLQCKISYTGADRRGMNSPETEDAAPWMPSGGSVGHKSSSARDSWTPGQGSVCYLWVIHRTERFQYARNKQNIL